MQNAKRNARNGRITGRGEQTREAGTDVSWRNGACVQTRPAHRDSTSKGTTQRAAMMAEAGVSAARLQDREVGY
jgi:hypothetical protein